MEKLKEWRMFSHKKRQPTHLPPSKLHPSDYDERSGRERELLMFCYFSSSLKRGIKEMKEEATSVPFSSSSPSLFLWDLQTADASC